MPAEDEAESTTKATVSEGEIEIRDKENQKQDLAGLNRDTQDALNKLGEIFDKDSIEERQELAGLFGELAYKAIGDLAVKNGWKDGSAEKNALHAFVGGIMAELGGSDFLAGASGSMVNEMVQEKLAEAFKDDPAMHQWVSALIGGVVSEIVSGNAQAGSSTAASGTKNNYLTHRQYLEYLNELAECKTNEEIKQVKEKYSIIDAVQDTLWLAKHNGELETVTPVGYKMDGSIAYLTPGEVKINSPEIQDMIDSIDNENRIFYNYKDGSAYYIDSDGVMYCGYDGKSLQRAATASVKTAIDLGIISNPSTMQTDYIYGQIGVGIYKNLSASVGFIVDKEGNI